VLFRPKKDFTRLGLRLKLSQETQDRLDSAGLYAMDYDERWGRPRIRLQPGEIEKNKDVLSAIQAEAWAARRAKIDIVDHAFYMHAAHTSSRNVFVDMDRSARNAMKNLRCRGSSERSDESDGSGWETPHKATTGKSAIGTTRRRSSGVSHRRWWTSRPDYAA